VLNCDVFLHPALLARLVEADGDALLYDSTSGHEDEHMKVSVSGGRLVRMSKEMPEDQVNGENVGVLRLSAQTVTDVLEAAREIVAAGDRRAWLASAINQVAGEHPITCLDVAPWPWVEIDFPEDLVRARVEVLPALAPALEAIGSDYEEPVTLRGVL
jgi:choline kinase